MESKPRKTDFIAAIIVTFIATRLLTFIWEIFSYWSGSMWSTLVDIYYISAATISGLEFLRITSLWIFFGFVTYFLTTPILNLTYYFRHKNREQNNLEATCSDASSTDDEPNILTKEDFIIEYLKALNKIAVINSKQLISLLQELTVLKNVTIIDKDTVKQKRSVVIGIVTIIIIFVFTIYTVAFMYFPYISRNAFENDIIRITPYVEATEIDRLRSDWVQMRGRADYEEIRSRIEYITYSNNLTR